MPRRPRTPRRCARSAPTSPSPRRRRTPYRAPTWSTIATSAKRPVLEHAWLAPGAHVNAVGASSPTAWEIEPETVAAAALFCDSRESVRNEAGEFKLAIEQGLISGEEHIRAELGEVVAGAHPGRESDNELTVFRSLGIGVEDLAAAQVAVQNARRTGLGTEVEL